MKKKVLFLFLRYVLILLFGIGGGIVFYKLFLSPTVFLSSKLLSLFGETQFVNDFIFFNNIPIEISKACVAAAAYYLFFILIMSFPLDLKKRTYLFLFNFLIFFIINVLRIFFMALLIKSNFFEEVHMAVWNLFSTIFVILVWFLSVKIFKIKEIPFYNDFIFLKSLIKKKKDYKKKIK